MAITPVDERDLDQLFADYRQRFGGRREDYFAFMYLTKKFDLGPEEIKSQVAFGGNDYGIDAFVVDRTARNLYLFQFKWTESAGQFKESLERLARDGLEMVFGDGPKDPTRNDFLHQLHDDLIELRNVIERVYIQLVFKGDIDVAENSAGLKFRKEDLESKRHIIDRYFGREQMPFNVDFISDRRAPRQAPPPATFRIRMGTTVETSADASGNRLLVGFVPLCDLYDIYRSLGQTFLSRNIRAGLSADNPPNRKIREALVDIVLKSRVDPAEFAFNHNGVTLAVERVEAIDGGMALHTPRLLNGAQTITSVVARIRIPRMRDKRNPERQHTIAGISTGCPPLRWLHVIAHTG